MSGVEDPARILAEKRTMLEIVRQLDREIERFLTLSKDWPRVETIRVAVGWMGVERATAMNDYLESVRKDKE